MQDPEATKMTLLHYPRKPSGEYRVTPLDGGPISSGPTMQCVHCGLTWEVRLGSGKQRGWCFKCSGPTCGGAACGERCIPWEIKLEREERRAQLRNQVRRNLQI